MPIRLLSSAEDFARYDTWVKSHPEGSLWQSLEWKKYQEAIGREIRIYADCEGDAIQASALISIDRTTGGFSTWDCPRGPLGPLQMENGALRQAQDDRRMENFLKAITTNAKTDKCLSVFFSPALFISHSQFSILNSQLRVCASARHQQPEATRIINLTLSEEDILKQMHQKGRYNIKVAQKNTVTVEQSIDIGSYAKLSLETSARDGFVGASKKQYEAFLNHLPGSFLMLAYAPRNSKPIAGLLGVIYKKTGIYYYGASDYEHRALMAPYLLQWEAMKFCKVNGCEKYDLLGIAPEASSDQRTADSNDKDKAGHSPLTALRSVHPWSGISDFKSKFGGDIVTHPPEQEIVLKPVVRGLLKMKRKMMG